jgi:hypothetical protein
MQYTIDVDGLYNSLSLLINNNVNIYTIDVDGWYNSLSLLIM